MSGMEVEPSPAAAKAEYQGERYWFCSQACKAELERKPEQYAVKRPQATKTR